MISRYFLFIQTFCYGFNFFLPSLLMIFFGYKGAYNLSGDLGLIISLNIFLTQIFSSNARSLIIKKKSINFVRKNYVLRIFLAFPIIIINLIIINYFDFSHQIFLFLLVILILQQWIFEINLSINEFNKKRSFFFSFIILSTLTCFSILYKIELFLILINILYISYFFITSKNIINFKKLFINIYAAIEKILRWELFSSLSLNFVNLIWRILIVIYCGKIIASIYFSAFAIASMFGTIFNITYGPTVTKNKIKQKNLENLIFSIITIMIIFFIFYSFINKDKIFNNFEQTVAFILSFSLVGSILMYKSQYFRQYVLQNYNLKNKIFKFDVIYSIIILPVIPVLFYLGGSNYVSFAFLTSSIISFVIYFNIKNRLSQ